MTHKSVTELHADERALWIEKLEFYKSDLLAAIARNEREARRRPERARQLELDNNTYRSEIVHTERILERERQNEREIRQMRFINTVTDGVQDIVAVVTGDVVSGEAA